MSDENVLNTSEIGTYTTIEPSIVMEVDNAISIAIGQTYLDESDIFSPVGWVKAPTRSASSEELPGHGETEDVETIIVNEVLHLSLSIQSTIRQKRGNRSCGIIISIFIYREINSSDVDTREADFCCLRRWRNIAGYASSGARASLPGRT